MYEFQPAAGIKVSRISNLADDLAMALSAVSIRIIAPIPGKDVVGIEIPNKIRQTVYFKEIIESGQFASSNSFLSLARKKYRRRAIRCGFDQDAPSSCGWLHRIRKSVSSTA